MRERGGRNDIAVPEQAGGRKRNEVKVKVLRNRLKSPEGGRGVTLHSLDLGARRAWVVSTTPRPLYPRERPGTHCTGGWVGPRVGLDVCEKSHLYRDSIPGSSSSYPVALPTELSCPPPPVNKLV
jgi:hypothetical protein